MADYNEIYNRMQFDIEYTAKELGVAGITMNAMANRGLVEKIAAKPNRYLKLKNKLPIIMEIAEQHKDIEYFTLFNRDEKMGMFCRIKNSCVVDYKDSPYDISKVCRMKIGRLEYKI